MRLTIVCFFAVVCGSAQSLWFEPNQGQAHRSVQFLAHTPSGYVYFAHDKMAIRDVRMDLVGGNKRAKAEFEEPTGGISSYFIGRAEKDWHTGIPHYGRIMYKNVYAGIDLVYYGSGRDIEYDFILKPGADPNQIKLAYNKPVQIDSNGDLLIASLKQHRPKVFQKDREIACDYLVSDHGQIQITLAGYDHSQMLAIDPTIEYSTYLGGPSYDGGASIKVDTTGSAYITGTVKSFVTPQLNPFQQTSGLSQDAFVVKLSPKGDAIVYYALLGGDFDDAGSDIALDSAGSAIACGITASTNFPVKNAIQPEFGGGEFDGFVTKLSPDGTKLIYSTFIGGPAWDQANGVASDESGNAYVAAWVTNARLPTKNAFQSTPLGGIDSYIVKLSPTGTLLYATYLGGAASDVPRAIAVDSAGSAYVAGSSGSDDFPTKSAYLVARPIPGSPFLNAFVTKLSPGGNSLIYSTFVTGRSGSGAYRIAVDSGGKAYVLGTVSGPDFPVKNAMQPVFAGGDNDRIVFGLTPSGADLVFSTFLGGSGSEYLTGGIGVAPDGSIWITGATNSSDFPTRNAIQPYRGLGGLSSDNAFLTHFSAGGSLLFSTFFGGHTNDWADGVTVDASGSIYLTGTTYSTDFPVKAAYQPSLGGASDIFVTKFTPDATATSPLSVTPSVLPITFVIGGQVPPAQTVTVSSSGSSLSFTPTTDATWLKLSANATTTPASLSISIDPTGLNPGRYTGTIQIDAQTTVQVNLTILDRAPVVTSISPAVISPGQGDTIFTIIGSGFGVGSVAQLAGGGAPFPTTYVDTSTLQILIYGSLLAAPTTYSIIIVNPQSAPSSLLTLTVGIPAPQFAAAGIVNAASFAGGPVAPGEIITIFGTNLVNTVAFDEAPATLVYFSPTQVNVVVPYSVAGPTTTLKIATTSIQLPITASAPGIFAAVPGGDNILVLYATGCGPLTNDDLPRCALPVSVTVNDRPAQVLYAGIAPGLVQGANQINVQLPDGTTSGQLTIVLTAGDASSKPFVWNTQ